MHDLHFPGPPLLTPAGRIARAFGKLSPRGVGYAGGRALAPEGRTALVIGHEMIGQVVETGKSVTAVKPGDHAVFTVRRGCGASPRT